MIDKRIYNLVINNLNRIIEVKDYYSESNPIKAKIVGYYKRVENFSYKVGIIVEIQDNNNNLDLTYDDIEECDVILSKEINKNNCIRYITYNEVLEIFKDEIRLY